MHILCNQMTQFAIFLIFLSCYFINNEISACALKKKPHIVFIIADDLGWNDVSFHGSNQIPTPNIDALAYNGVILNRHYVLPICTPSRSSLMTSRYAIRDGMQGFPLIPGEIRGLPLNRTLMPEHLRRLGYSTHLIGKWHLGYYTENHTPTRRGFDKFYGYYNGLINYVNHTVFQFFSDSIYIGNDLHRDDSESLRASKDQGYFNDLIIKEAVKIINSNGNDEPLFLEVSHLAVHANQNVDDPLEVPDLSQVDKDFPFIKKKLRRKYAGVLKSLDDSVGQIVKALSDADMLQNSIIIFMSDNGAPTINLFANDGSNYPLRGIKSTLFEGAVRGAACIFSPRIISPGRVSEETIHIVDWLPTLYAAAGGNLKDLGNDIDGVNQWPAIVHGRIKSSRSSLLVNIDDLEKKGAAIIGRYKLIKGSEISGTDYYGEGGSDPSYPDYDPQKVLYSPAGMAINQLPGFVSASISLVQSLRKKSTLICKHSTTYANCTKLCLFDVIDDPCETTDLSNKLPQVVSVLESFISKYWKVLKPQKEIIVDPRSNPANFNGTWMPWLSDESSFIE